MPRYDYRCSGCGHVYEKREGFDAPSIQQCPDCNGEARRVLTPPAIVFKGSGWYVNDSRKGTAGTEAAAGSSKSDSSDAAEAKPAAAESKSESSTSSAPAPAAAAD